VSHSGHSSPSARAAGAGVDVTSVEGALVRVMPLLAARPLALISDFDGTLARLSPDPWGPQIMPAARRALRALAGLDDVHVVLLSGRGVTDLSGRVAVGGVNYLGDHGAESGSLPRRFRRREPVVVRELVDPGLISLGEALAEEVRRAVSDEWLVVEPKLPTVCFHFRTAPDPDAARARVSAACDRIDPRGVMLRTHGRRSLELRPVGAASKGPAMARLLDGLRPAGAIMLGDDPNDAAAFRALHDHAAGTGAGALAVAVMSHPEWLPLVAPEADLVLADPGEAARLLARLARELRSDRG
jgi:trehalose 6-phosphate phosphatase